jgi:hypothetical protein
VLIYVLLVLLLTSVIFAARGLGNVPMASMFKVSKSPKDSDDLVSEEHVVPVRRGHLCRPVSMSDFRIVRLREEALTSAARLDNYNAARYQEGILHLVSGLATNTTKESLVKIELMLRHYLSLLDLMVKMEKWTYAMRLCNSIIGTAETAADIGATRFSKLALSKAHLQAIYILNELEYEQVCDESGAVNFTTVQLQLKRDEDRDQVLSANFGKFSTDWSPDEITFCSLSREKNLEAILYPPAPLNSLAVSELGGVGKFLSTPSARANPLLSGFAPDVVKLITGIVEGGRYAMNTYSQLWKQLKSHSDQIVVSVIFVYCYNVYMAFQNIN